MVLSPINDTLETTAKEKLPSGITCILIFSIVFFSGCAKQQVLHPEGQGRLMEVTGYCGCSTCCGWERGSWSLLKLDFWNRYVNYGKYSGKTYSGLTAAGTTPTEPQAGFFSVDSLERPWMIPTRLILSFGTRMYVPGYGWGIVEDKGGKIKGPDRIDLFFESHEEAMQWGRKKINVVIEKP